MRIIIAGLATDLDIPVKLVRVWSCSIPLLIQPAKKNQMLTTGNLHSYLTHAKCLQINNNIAFLRSDFPAHRHLRIFWRRVVLTLCVEISFESQRLDPNQTSFNHNGGAHNRKNYIYVHTFHGNQLPISSPSLLIVFAKWAGPYQEMFTVNEQRD